MNSYEISSSLINVGWRKGEPDFGVLASIEDLSLEQMNALRAMTMVAIGTAEDMWRRGQQRRHPAGATATAPDAGAGAK